MTKNNNNSTGPQGTQVFDINDVNKMIAEKITNSQASDAETPALIGVSEALRDIRHIFDKDKIVIGRRPNSDIVLNEASVSAMHAQIVRFGDEWKVMNLLSSNGTFVNGEKVSERVIRIGDRIAFAEAEFVFALVEAPVVKKSSKNNLQLVLIAAALVVAFAALLYFIL